MQQQGTAHTQGLPTMTRFARLRRRWLPPYHSASPVRFLTLSSLAMENRMGLPRSSSWPACGCMWCKACGACVSVTLHGRGNLKCSRCSCKRRVIRTHCPIKARIKQDLLNIFVEPRQPALLLQHLRRSTVSHFDFCRARYMLEIP